MDSGTPPEIAIGPAFQHPKMIGKASQEFIKKNTLSNPLGKISIYSFDTANAHTKTHGVPFISRHKLHSPAHIGC